MTNPESILQDISEFVKKIFTTFFTLLLFPKRFFRSLYSGQNSRYIEPLTFFSIITILAISINITTAKNDQDIELLSLIHSISDTITNLSFIEKVLWTFPIVLIFNVFISVITTVLFKKGNVFILFKKYFTYCMSLGIILPIILKTFFSTEEDGTILFTIIVSFITVFIVSFIGIKSCYSFTRTTGRKFLTIAIISPFALVLFVFIFLQEYEIFNKDDKLSIEVVASDGKHSFPVTLSKENNDSLILSFHLLMKNLTSSDIYISILDTLVSSPHYNDSLDVIKFAVKGDKINYLKELKANGMLGLTLETKVSSNWLSLNDSLKTYHFYFSLKYFERQEVKVRHFRYLKFYIENKS